MSIAGNGPIKSEGCLSEDRWFESRAMNFEDGTREVQLTMFYEVIHNYNCTIYL